jgi:hypothetical protein
VAVEVARFSWTSDLTIYFHAPPLYNLRAMKRRACHKPINVDVKSSTPLSTSTVNHSTIKLVLSTVNHSTIKLVLFISNGKNLCYSFQMERIFVRYEEDPYPKSSMPSNQLQELNPHRGQVHPNPKLQVTC